jgi:hypothetical protein
LEVLVTFFTLKTAVRFGQEKRDQDHPKRQEKRGSAASQEIPDQTTAWDVMVGDTRHARRSLIQLIESDHFTTEKVHQTI